MSEFQARVLKLVAMVPKGKVITYKELARAVGRPRAYRAVANALARNPQPLKIPCHRVVKSNGEIGGYKLGPKQKARLLLEEGVRVEGTKIDIGKYLFRF